MDERDQELSSRCGGVSRHLLAMSLRRWLEQCCLCQVSFWEVCCLLPPNGRNAASYSSQHTSNGFN